MEGRAGRRGVSEEKEVEERKESTHPRPVLEAEGGGKWRRRRRRWYGL